MIPSKVQFPVPFQFAFRSGATFKCVVPAKDWDGKYSDGQARDQESGERLWLITIEDEDPRAAEFGRDRQKVKYAGPEAPAPPPAPIPTAPGYRPVELVDLVLTPWVDDSRCKSNGHRCRARLAWSMRASGLVAPTS